MATTIQVVMQEDLVNVGKSGDLVKVRPGFARNYLLPRGFAVTATAAAVNRINHEKAVAVARGEKQKKEATDVAAKINATTLTLSQRVGEDDKLFGAVTTKDIEAAAKAKGLEIDRKKLHLAEPIRALGTYEVPVKLHATVTATLKVEVVKK
ncbi:MAG: 50S ribosomal protein L9 [Polyangiaceae bacterium]